MTTLDEIIRRPELLDAELARGGAVIGRDRNHVFCIFHKHHDQTGSMSLFIGKEGKARFKCQACGAKGTIIDARALSAKITPAEAIRALLAEHGGTAKPTQTKASPPKKPAQIY